MPRKFAKKNTVKKLVSRVRALEKAPELKVLDAGYGNISANATAGLTFTKINPPAQGDAAGQRDGDQLLLKSISLRGEWDCQTTQTNRMRVLVLQWLEDDAVTAPSAVQILQDITGGEELNSFYRVRPGHKFKVLMDKRIYYDSNNASSNKPFVFSVGEKKLKIAKQAFNAGAITGVGNVYLLTMGMGVDGRITNVVARTRYTDM